MSAGRGRSGNRQQLGPVSQGVLGIPVVPTQARRPPVLFPGFRIYAHMIHATLFASSARNGHLQPRL